VLSKVTIAVIAAVGLMVGLVILSSIPRQSGSPLEKISNFHLEFSKQHQIESAQAGALHTSRAEILTIENNGSATYFLTNSDRNESKEYKFVMDSMDMNSLKSVISETGFMQIPQLDYQAKEGVANFTKYTLHIRIDNEEKTINWVDQSSYGGTIPPIIQDIGSRLDAIISTKIPV